MIEKSYIYAANASVIIASITAALTALSPTISNIINNHHNLKMKRIELYEEKRIEAINNYVSEVSKYIHNSSNENSSDMGQTLNSIYLYAPKEIWNDIKSLNEFVEKLEFEKAMELLPEIAQKLSPNVIKRKHCGKNK